MAKKFKEFRKEYHSKDFDDEWGDSSEYRKKDVKMQKRREERRAKTYDKFSKLEDHDS